MPVHGGAEALSPPDLTCYSRHSLSHVLPPHKLEAQSQRSNARNRGSARVGTGNFGSHDLEPDRSGPPPPSGNRASRVGESRSDPLRPPAPGPDRSASSRVPLLPRGARSFRSRSRAPDSDHQHQRSLLPRLPSARESRRRDPSTQTKLPAVRVSRRSSRRQARSVSAPR